MDGKLPYYMAYPMSLDFDEERIERMDLEYMKSMYPDMAKKILPYVEEECDRMEYEGSMMFDEYPDQLQLLLMSRRILGKMDDEDKGNDLVQEMVRVMLYQEIYKRRCDHRRYKRKLFPGMKIG